MYSTDLKRAYVNSSFPFHSYPSFHFDPFVCFVMFYILYVNYILVTELRNKRTDIRHFQETTVIFWLVILQRSTHIKCAYTRVCVYIYSRLAYNANSCNATKILQLLFSCNTILRTARYLIKLN